VRLAADNRGLFWRHSRLIVAVAVVLIFAAFRFWPRHGAGEVKRLRLCDRLRGRMV
jgi:hypothetical protein